MSELLVWRWCFAEMSCTVGAYAFATAIFTIKKGQKWRVWLMGMVCTVLYLFILFGFHFDPYSNGIMLRILIYVPQYLLIPMLFVEGKGWKYVSYGITNSFISSFLMDGVVFGLIIELFTPTSLEKGIDITYFLYYSKQYAYIFYMWCVLKILLFFALIPAYRFLQKSFKRWKRFTNASIVLNAVFFSSLVFISMDNIMLSNQIYTVIFSSIITFCVMGYICWGMYHDKKQAIVETEYLHMQQELQEEQLKELNESQTRTRKLRHDLKNHIETIRMLVEHDKPATAREYANNIMREYDNE